MKRSCDVALGMGVASFHQDINYSCEYSSSETDGRRAKASSAIIISWPLNYGPIGCCEDDPVHCPHPIKFGSVGPPTVNFFEAEWLNAMSLVVISEI